jgi:aromatic-L-amino-acid/L-tryptophan decarboxylase
MSDQLRPWLHRIAEWVADYRDTIAQQHVTPHLGAEDVAAAFPAVPPEHGDKLTAIFEDVERFVVPGLVHTGHPKFLSDGGGLSPTPAILGEWLATAVGAGVPASPVTIALERTVLRWIGSALGLAGIFNGALDDSAASATLHALFAARDAAYPEAGRRGLAGAPPLMIYTSAEASEWVEHTAVTLGLGRDSVRRLETDGELRLRPTALRAAIARDLHARLRPFVVVATVGTPACGAVDPVPAIADVCAENRLWLHVDASYGAGLAVLPEGRWVLDGVGRADSVVISSQAWLPVPTELTALYSGRAELSRERPTGNALAALHAWMAMRALGRVDLEVRMRERVRLARRFADWVEADPDFELMAPVTIPIVCFRARPAAMAESDTDALNERLVAQLARSGRVYLTGARLGGHVTIRVAVANILTTEAQLADAWTIIHDVFDRTLLE